MFIASYRASPAARRNARPWSPLRTTLVAEAAGSEPVISRPETLALLRYKRAASSQWSISRGHKRAMISGFITRHRLPAGHATVRRDQSGALLRRVPRCLFHMCRAALRHRECAVPRATERRRCPRARTGLRCRSSRRQAGAGTAAGSAGCSVSINSTSLPSIRSPGCLTRNPMPIAMSGLRRNRRCADDPETSSPKVSRGGRRNSTHSSVAVTGNCLPARM